MTDQLSICRHCSSPLCYETHEEHTISWRCLKCGFQTNTFLLEGTEGVKALEETLPSLFKDIKFKDEDGFIWYPQYLNIEGVGMITPDGAGKDDWFWAFFPHIPVEEHEKERFKGAKYKINTHAALRFEKDQFYVAIQACGLI